MVAYAKSGVPRAQAIAPTEAASIVAARRREIQNTLTAATAAGQAAAATVATYKSTAMLAGAKTSTPSIRNITRMAATAGTAVRLAPGALSA